MKNKILVLAISSIAVTGCTSEITDTEATPEGLSPASSAPPIAETSVGTDDQLLPEALWQTSFLREQSKNSALAEAFAYFEANRNESCSTGYKLHLQLEIAEESEIREIVEETLAIFCDVLNEDPVIIVGNYVFAKDQITANGYASDEYGGVCGKASPGWSAGCALHNVTWQHIKFSGSAKMNQIVAHEIFHVVQDASNEIEYFRIPPGDDRYMPTWFAEGFAMVYEGALLEYLGLGDYTESYGYDPELFVPSWFLEKIELSQREADGSLGTYAIGHFAVEYLVANVGFEAVLSVWSEMDKGKSFDEAFSAATGQTVTDFYQKVSEISLQH